MNLRNHEAMLQAFGKFADRMAQRYEQVQDCLKIERYEEAQELLSEIATSHAKTSLSLRNLLVKHGVMGGNK